MEGKNDMETPDAYDKPEHEGSVGPVDAPSWLKALSGFSNRELGMIVSTASELADREGVTVVDCINDAIWELGFTPTLNRRIDLALGYGDGDGDGDGEEEEG